MSYNECPSSNNTECHSEKTAAFTKHWHHLNAGQQEKPGREVPRPFPLPQGTLSQDVHLPNSHPPLCLKSSRNGLSRHWGWGGVCQHDCLISISKLWFRGLSGPSSQGWLGVGGSYWYSLSCRPNSLPPHPPTPHLSFHCSPCWPPYPWSSH